MHFDIKPLDLLSLVEQAITANHAYGEQFGVTFQLTCTLPPVQVSADHNRLLQVLTNLLSNAAKFSAPASQVDVTITRSAEGMLRVAVIDHGSGIPEEFRSRIFQKFAQADASTTRQKGGTGLGLSISKAIIEKLGGRIGFETEINIGTTFYFDLPEHCQLPQSAPLNQPQMRVLICEDSPDVAMLLSLILKQAGFSTDIAYNADQAKQFLAQQHYDAMTVDLMLPGQDGISLIRELREQEVTRSLPVVVVSACPHEEAELSTGSLAIIDCLEKPINPERLMVAVQQAVLQTLGNKPRVLHIEDDLDVVQVVATILNGTAHVTSALSLQEALHQLSQQTFDLVILDLNLKDGMGMELIPYLNSQGSSPIPVVVFSAQEVSQEAFHQVTAALVKSRTSNQELLQTIQSLIRRRRTSESHPSPVRVLE